MPAKSGGKGKKAMPAKKAQPKKSAKKAQPKGRGYGS